MDTFCIPAHNHNCDTWQCPKYPPKADRYFVDDRVLTIRDKLKEGEKRWKLLESDFEA